MMLERIARHIRGNVVGYLALFVALTGTAMASGVLNKAKVNKIISQRAPSLSVNHAKSADSASGAQSLAAPEAFHEIGATGEPSFENGATNAITGFSTAGFYMDRQCVVHLKGTITAASQFSAFTLPAADRPAQHQSAAVAVSNGSPVAGIVEILTNGQVKPISAATGTLTFGLDGVNFRAASC